MAQFFGSNNENINYLEKKFQIEIFSRGQSLTISGAPQAIKKVEEVVLIMIQQIENNEAISLGEIKQMSNGKDMASLFSIC